jgi:hypothetical protein
MGSGRARAVWALVVVLCGGGAVADRADAADQPVTTEPGYNVDGYQDTFAWGDDEDFPSSGWSSSRAVNAALRRWGPSRSESSPRLVLAGAGSRSPPTAAARDPATSCSWMAATSSCSIYAPGGSGSCARCPPGAGRRTRSPCGAGATCSLAGGPVAGLPLSTATQTLPRPSDRGRSTWRGCRAQRLQPSWPAHHFDLGGVYPSPGSGASVSGRPGRV